MKTKQIYWIGGGILGALSAFFAYDIIKQSNLKAKASSKEMEKNPSIEGSVSVDQQQSNKPKDSSDSFPIEIGDYGYKVSLLQSALKKLGASIVIDGKYGAKTYDAISDFGGLGFFGWGSTCSFNYACGLDEDEFNDILENARNKGWNEELKIEETAEKWNKFKGDEVFDDLMGQM